MNKLNKLKKWGVLALIGGIIYVALEVICRGYTHWTMVILGGICFVATGLINEIIPWEMPLAVQMLCGSIIITALEFACGCIVNVWLGWDVWDYSAEWGNLLGQICPLYSILWYFVSFLAIWLDDWLRYWLFLEDRPHYKLF